MRKSFKTTNGEIPLPIFFPDATRGVIRSLDSEDINKTGTAGILVNTYHLLHDVGEDLMNEYGGIRKLMTWEGGVISDSGGFQLMSLVKNCPGGSTINDKGIIFRLSKKTTVKLTPEDSIRFQMALKPDMVVVLDDFTQPSASEAEARVSVERTILWAKRSKAEFLRICEEKNIPIEKRPYILGVIQGDRHLGLRRECASRLIEIGFDGLGYGGWPMLPDDGGFDWEVAKLLAEITPKEYFLYGLGVGKPEDIVGCVRLGFNIFDCVLPTRDGRHERLYVYDEASMEKIDPAAGKFYHYFTPGEKYQHDLSPVSRACDCLLCTNYSRAYLTHLFKIEEVTAWRLATIHNLRFYSLLMEKLRVTAK